MVSASAGERVTFNETVLDCSPEGCFVLRYVPAPSLKREIAMNDQPDRANAQAQPPTKTEQPETAEEIAPPVETPSDAESPKGNEEKTGNKTENNRFDAIRLATVLNAIAAVAVAAFTGLLVYFNWGMSSAAQKQAATMEKTLSRMEADSIAQAEQFAAQLAVAQQSANAAAAAAETANLQFLAAARPTLTVDVEVVEGLIWRENGIGRLGFALNTTNTGNGTAINVQFAYEVILRLGPDTELEKQAQLSKRLKETKPTHLPITVTKAQTIVFHASGDLITPHKIEMYRRYEESMGRERNQWIYPTLVGCVQYESLETGKTHQTGFIVNLEQIDPEHPNMYPANVFTVGEDVPVHLLRVMMSSYGHGIIY
ncbi:MAG: hypothetical protein AB7F91_17830 [Parvularculaceae bacterium]